MSDKQKIVAKLLKIYAAIDFVEKGGENKIQSYKYVRAADVIHSVRKACMDEGIYAEINLDFVEPSYTIARAKEPTAPFSAVNVKCSVVLHDQESGEIMTASGLGTGADTSDKAVYKAQTGAVKYALRNAFMIPDEADPEADESVEERPAHPTQAAKPAAAKASTATQAAKPTATTTSISTTEVASSQVLAPNGAMPTEAEMDEFRKRFDKLREDLKEKGKLKASTNPAIPIAVKLRNFMTSIEGVKTPNDMSVAQWTDFFSRADHVAELENGWVGLAKLVNKANGIEEVKK